MNVSAVGLVGLSNLMNVSVFAPYGLSNLMNISNVCCACEVFDYAAFGRVILKPYNCVITCVVVWSL